MYSNKNSLDKSIVDAQVRMFRECVEKLSEFKNGWQDNWRYLSDLANMCETYVTHNNGVWKTSATQIVALEDIDGVIDSSIKLLAKSGIQAKSVGYSGLTDSDKDLLNDLIDCYEEILSIVTAREANKCRNITSSRIKQILSGSRLEHDFVV